MPKIIIMLSLAGIAVAFVLWDRFSTPKGMVEINASTQQKELNPAPDVSFKGINGKGYTLEQFKGKTVILNFWATWCSPCLIEFPQLLELAKQDQENIVFIALSVDEDPKAIEDMFSKAGKSFKENLKLENVIIGIDSDKLISKDIFGTIRYPETYIITPDAKIKSKIKGARNWLSVETTRIIYNK